MALPVPVADVWIASQIRSDLLAELLKKQGQVLTPELKRVLNATGFQDALKQTLKKKNRWLLRIMQVEEMFSTLYFSYMFDHALKQRDPQVPLTPLELKRIMNALEESWTKTILELPFDAFKIIGEKRSLPDALKESLALRFEHVLSRQTS